MNLTGIGSELTKLDLNPTKETAQTGSPGNILGEFGNIFKDSLNHVNELEASAQKAQTTYATGGKIELHQVMIATERAELALELTGQIRNKLLQAYQEINHMSV